MNGSRLQQHIKEKMDQICESVVFCCEKKYRDLIKNKIANMPFYVYDNNLDQMKRLKEIDLYEVALEFALDVSDDLDIDGYTKYEVEKQIAKLIIDIDNEGYIDEKIKQRIAFIPQLSHDSNKYFNIIKKVVNYYQKDAHVKYVKKVLENDKYKRKEFEDKHVQLKKSILEKHFGLSMNVGSLNKPKTDYLWLLFETGFNPAGKKIIEESEEHSKNIAEVKFDFYTCLGCEGETIEQLEAYAKQYGLYIDENKFNIIMDDYLEKFNKLLEEYFYAHSNLKLIEDDLVKNGYSFNKKFIVDYIMANKGLLGANFVCRKDEKLTSFVLFMNDLNAYSSHFSETVIHETMHYLAGKSDEVNKCGFVYGDEEKYIYLEEAWVYFMAKKIGEVYREKYGTITTILTNKKTVSMYDETFDYMEKVYELYKEQLFHIYFSEDISLIEARELMPFEDISDALYKIVNAKDCDKKKFIRAEITKLSKGGQR